MRLSLRRNMLVTLTLVLIVGALLGACSKDTPNKEGNGGDTSSSGYLQKALDGEYKGKKVTMFGPFVDEDEAKFLESIKAFEEQSGIDISYEGSKEFEATITVRINGGNAPDIADFPQPGLLKTFVKDGKVIDVGSFLAADYLKKQYKQSWLDMAAMEGADGKEQMAGV